MLALLQPFRWGNLAFLHGEWGNLTSSFTEGSDVWVCLSCALQSFLGLGADLQCWYGPSQANKVCFLPGLLSWGAEPAFCTLGTSLSCTNSAGPPGIPGSLIQYSLVRHGIKKDDKNRFTDPLGQAGAGYCCCASGLICLCSLAKFRLASREKDRGWEFRVNLLAWLVQWHTTSHKLACLRL